MKSIEQNLANLQSTSTVVRARAVGAIARRFLESGNDSQQLALLYAGLMMSLDDISAQVRAVMAGELIHAPKAPRPVILALAQDVSVISCAILQHSPVLMDADLVDLAATGGQGAIYAITQRQNVSSMCAAALIELGDERAILSLLQRRDVELAPVSVSRAGERFATNGRVRELLLLRDDLADSLRAELVGHVRENLLGSKLVRACIGRERMARRLDVSHEMMQLESADCWDGEVRMALIAEMQSGGRLNTKILLRALVFGHFNFLESALHILSNVPPSRLANLFVHGRANAIGAMLTKAGLSPVLAEIFARGILQSRGMDLENSASARHHFLSLLLADILAEHNHDLPEDFTAAFSYLSQLNLEVGRTAAQQIVRSVAPVYKQLTAA